MLLVKENFCAVLTGFFVQLYLFFFNFKACIDLATNIFFRLAIIFCAILEILFFMPRYFYAAFIKSCLVGNYFLMHIKHYFIFTDLEDCSQILQVLLYGPGYAQKDVKVSFRKECNNF